MRAIAFDAPNTPDAFAFVQRLEDRLGRSVSPRFRLAYTLTTNAVGGGFTPDNRITRYTLSGTARFRLLDAASGAELTQGTAESFTGWATTGSTAATLVAEADAHRRLMIVLADQTVSRLLAQGLR